MPRHAWYFPFIHQSYFYTNLYNIKRGYLFWTVRLLYLGCLFFNDYSIWFDLKRKRKPSGIEFFFKVNLCRGRFTEKRNRQDLQPWNSFERSTVKTQGCLYTYPEISRNARVLIYHRPCVLSSLCIPVLNRSFLPFAIGLGLLGAFSA